ncbi:hypothetical protein [Polaribacter vadi]|uniref:hypothetical protein n=1 Tax=Polaribacter vadi TaxID=1774273 RepID=UPI0030EEB980|tara:strand:- start:49123 stop:49314 length:192 start_codon:yes stop_codon:yes gene_type:complete
MKYYNHNRYPTNLLGLTPFEAVNGKIPNKNHFKEKIQQARKNRVVLNQYSMIIKLFLVVILKI